MVTYLYGFMNCNRYSKRLRLFFVVVFSVIKFQNIFYDLYLTECKPQLIVIIVSVQRDRIVYNMYSSI